MTTVKRAPGAGPDELQLVACPLCGGEVGDRVVTLSRHPDQHIDGMRRLFGEAERSVWRVCGVCGFVHQNPRPSTAALNRLYYEGGYHPADIPEQYLGEGGTDRYAEFALWYYEAKVDYSLVNADGPREVVLDIGSGYGGALHRFGAKGLRTYGAEPDPVLAGFATAHMGVSGVQRALVADGFALPEPVDVGFSNHTFEHVADLTGMMTALAGLIRTGGALFTCVPTYYANRSDMSLQWMNSAHYSLFTHRSLSQLGARFGFEYVTHTYRGWRRAIDEVWHVGRYTGVVGDPTTYYEDPDEVLDYINRINRMRSIAYWPLYSRHDRRSAIVHRVEKAALLARTSPKELVTEVRAAIRRDRVR